MSRKADAQPTAASSTEEIVVNIPPGARSPKTRLITRSQIHPDPEQPREHADSELRASIASQGLLEPIIVRPHPEISTEWMIVNGERRWRGSDGVLNDLQCIVRTDLADPVARLAVQLVANTGKPMTALEEAKSFRRMIEANGASVAELAKQLGRAPSTVAERLALLELGPWLELIEAGQLVMSHAVKVLLPLRTVPDEQHEKAIALLLKDYRWANKGRGEGISLGDFERLVQQLYRSTMYPLTKTKASYAKQPEFNTSKHDAECGCGGIKFDLGMGNAPRLCCGNPTWWGPLHRAALKANKPKSKPGDRANKPSFPKAPSLHLPEGTKTLKSEYGAVPKGAIVLTNSRGQWCTADDEERPFDPADLDLTSLPLVQWPGSQGESVRVGTKDAAAVDVAVKLFAERLTKHTASADEKFARALQHKRNEYLIIGVGARLALPYVLVDVENNSADDALEAVEDVARHYSVTLPDSLYYVDELMKWAKKLSTDTAADLLIGILIVLNEKVRGASGMRRELQEELATKIAARPVPWLKPTVDTEPKNPAKKKVVTKKRNVSQALALEQFSEETLEMPLGISSVDEDDEEDGGWTSREDDGDDLWSSDAEEEDDAAGAIVGSGSDEDED